MQPFSNGIATREQRSNDFGVLAIQNYWRCCLILSTQYTYISSIIAILIKPLTHGLLLVASGCFWFAFGLLLGASGCFWRLLVASGGFWLLLVIFWVLLVASSLLLGASRCALLNPTFYIDLF